MTFEDEDMVTALKGIRSVLRDLLMQMRRSEASKLQRHTQLLATLRTLAPKETRGE